MRNLILALAATTALAGTANAATVYSNNFDAENGGNTALNYTAFNGLTVTGNVDLTRSGDFYPCAGGSGSCVDLDGTTGPGRLTSASYNFTANQRVTLSFDLAGNQRNGDTDDFFAGFSFANATTIGNYTIGFGGTPVNIGGFSGISGITSFSSVVGTDGFSTRSLSFTTSSAGSLQFYIGTGSADNIGPVLDNLSLSVAAVPEPGTWALMILGFGMVGGAMRRRSAAKVRFA